MAVHILSVMSQHRRCVGPCRFTNPFRAQPLDEVWAGDDGLLEFLGLVATQGAREVK